MKHITLHSAVMVYCAVNVMSRVHNSEGIMHFLAMYIL